MPILGLIWMTALGLIALAIAWMIALILLRVIHELRSKRRAADRTRVMGALVGVLQGREGAIQILETYKAQGILMAEALLELNAVVRGADRERVLIEVRKLGLPKLLTRQMLRGAPAERLSSLEALAALAGAEATTALRTAWRTGAPPVREAALNALVEAGAPISIGEVLDGLIAGELPATRTLTEVVRRTTMNDTRAAAAALQRRDLTELARALLLDSLGSSGDYQVIPNLIAGALDNSPEIRTAAVRGLGRLMHPAGQAAIGDALLDPSWHVRSAAAEAAGAAGLVALSDRLSALLADPDWWVRFRAGEALARLGAPGVARLRQVVQSELPVASRMASLALAERGLQ